MSRLMNRTTPGRRRVNWAPMNRSDSSRPRRLSMAHGRRCRRPIHSASSSAWGESAPIHPHPTPHRGSTEAPPRLHRGSTEAPPRLHRGSTEAPPRPHRGARLGSAGPGKEWRGGGGASATPSIDRRCNYSTETAPRCWGGRRRGRRLALGRVETTTRSLRHRSRFRNHRQSINAGNSRN